MNAIRVRDVTKRYGDVTALNGLSLSVGAGTTFGLLGTNGAGKTTLFKLLVGHLRPDDGTVEVAGRRVATAGSRVRERVGYLPEHAGFPASLTGREVLAFHARVRGLDPAGRDDRIREVLSTVRLSEAADRAVSGYSNGMNRRLGLATALLPRPEVLLLDEPTAGLDPRGVAAFHRIVRTLRAETDLTVVLSSHVLDEVQALCDEIAILDGGELRVEGSVEALRRELTDAVTIDARLAADADPAAAAEAARRFAEEVGVDDQRLAATCPQAATTDLLTALDDAVELDGYEVREPGLDEVFERVLRERSPNGTDDRPDENADNRVSAS